ncbi:MAG TPA: alcohol dehydrogenase catalytic domain-containing protein [Thermomicrobiales bacterium]
MESTMLAVVCHGPKDYRVEEVPVPQPGPGEILIEVGAAGICASDMKCFLGAPLFWGRDGKPGYVEGPCIAGHEYAGRVVALGEGAEERHGVKIGDRVVAEQIVPCGTCRYCRDGYYWMCQPHHIFGFKRYLNGGMAKYNLFPAKARVHHVPESLSDGEAAYIEPLACAWHAVERGEIKPGDTVAIGGVGNIGLCMLQVAKLYNPGCLIALDTKQYRLDLAKQFGADVAIDVTKGDAVQQVLDLTEGYGCDVYIEASGSPAGVVQGLQMIRKLGTFVEFSVFGEQTTVDWTIIGDTKELNIHGSHLGPYCYPKAIKALAEGKVNVKPLLADSYPISRFPEAMEAALSGGVLKTLVVPE